MKTIAENPLNEGTSTAILPSRFVDWLLERGAEIDLLRKGERTRFALKSAAARLLEEKGYDRFSTGDVSDYAEVTRTAFYTYFPSKQALVLELLEDFRLADPAKAVLQTNLAYVRFFSVNARVILSIQHVRRALSGAERQHFDLNDWWARKVAQAILQNSSTENQERSRFALATAYALETMVDGFLTELYVRQNPNLLALKLSETEVAQILSDIWNAATGHGTASVATAMMTPPAGATGKKTTPQRSKKA
ncbi:MAG: transcriptional regulator TetR family [Comamonadaceae bacterium]|nr:MAG: transcriptional regulator TetR family [Comamonadaceae bacterium]